MLADQASVREYHNDPFEPCSSLASEFVPACIYWQPQWWLSVSTDTDTAAKFKTMGAYCRTFIKNQKSLSKSTISRSCFEGIGNVVESASDFAPAKAIQLCDAGGERNERLLCRAIGANHFGIDVNAKAAEAVCEGLTADERTFCIAYAENRSNIANELPLSF